jgi:hypothetical protein
MKNFDEICPQGVLEVKFSKQLFYYSHPRYQNTKMYVVHKGTSD